MLQQELQALVRRVQREKCEGQHIEVKKAGGGAPGRLYDTLSAFANRDGGGTILFGVDEAQGFAVTGVYDAQDLQKRVVEQCEQMEPKLRPLFTVCEIDGKTVVGVEIGECDVYEKPCFYTGKGRIRGSYIRVGEADKPMTEYEVYSYEAFRRKIQDELRTTALLSADDLNRNALTLYFAGIREKKPQLALQQEEKILALQGMFVDGQPTVICEMLFGSYPQSIFPQYCILASVVPGVEIGETGAYGERFTDDRRIEGTIPQMLEEAMTFVQKNMRRSIIVDDNGKRTDRPEYPVKAVREAVLNALIHRDYSLHTENAPIRLLLFSNRLVVENPGGLYGRGTIDSLGVFGLDTRNPFLAGALEIMIDSENRYSGVPVMRAQMKQSGLLPPLFESTQGVFRVTLYNSTAAGNELEERILRLCREPKSREELARAFGFETPTYFLNTYVKPLVARGLLAMTLPQTPKSKKQKYVTLL